MGGVSGVGGGNEIATQSSNQTAQADQAKELQRMSSSQVEANTAQQTEQQRQLTGSVNAQQAQMAAMMMQQQMLGAGNAYDTASPEVRVKATELGKQVFQMLRTQLGQMQNQMTSQEQAGGASAGGGAEEGSQNQLGSQNSNMLGSNPTMDAADQQIQEAAKVSVYRDIVGMLNGMNDKRVVKDNLRQAEASISAVLARAKPGDKVRIPVFEFDEKTGKVTQKGVKEMSYEEAVAQRDKLRDTRDSISEANEMDMLMLQQLMEKKGQLESMISNCMKASYEGGQAAVSALKAS